MLRGLEPRKPNHEKREFERTQRATCTPRTAPLAGQVKRSAKKMAPNSRFSSFFAPFVIQNLTPSQPPPNLKLHSPTHKFALALKTQTLNGLLKRRPHRRKLLLVGVSFNLAFTL